MTAVGVPRARGPRSRQSAATRVRRGLASMLVTGMVVAAACEAGNITGASLDFVVTLVDTTTPALASARTFAIPDTIVPLEGSGTINHSADHVVVDSVRAHFLQLGWIERRDPAGERPDVVILLGVSTRTETGVAYGGWYGAYGGMPYWGGVADPTWAFGAPVWGVEYSYDVGTLVMTMIDLRAPRATTKVVPVLWIGALNGVLNGNDGVARVQRGLDQAFAQSPYLRIQ